MVGKKAEMKSVDVPPAPSAEEMLTPEQRKERDAKLENPDYQGKESEKKAGAEKEVDEGPPRAPRPVLGYVLAGGGLVAVGVGTIFGLKAISDRNDSTQHCGQNGCTVEGYDLNQSAKTAAWVSDFGIGLGLVGVAVGGYMLLKPRPLLEQQPEAGSTARVHVIPAVTANSASLELGGAW